MKQEYHIIQRGQLHGVHDTGYCTVKSLHTYQRVSDVQTRGTCKDQAEDRNRKGDEPVTKKIREYGAKENTAEFNFSNCSVVFNISKLTFVIFFLYQKLNSFFYIIMLFSGPDILFLFFCRFQAENILELFLIINNSLWDFRFRVYWGFNYQSLSPFSTLGARLQIFKHKIDFFSNSQPRFYS